MKKTSVKKLLTILIVLMLALLLSSCDQIVYMFSDGTEEFNSLMKYVREKENEISKCPTINNVKQLKSVKRSLDDFANKYTRSKHKSEVERKSSDLYNIINSTEETYRNLIKILDTSMENAVAGIAKKQHMFSNIESIKKISEKNIDNNNCTTSYIRTYHISMKGAFLGINTYDLEIEVVATIDYKTGRGRIDDINIISDIQNS